MEVIQNPVVKKKLKSLQTEILPPALRMEKMVPQASSFTSVKGPWDST